MTTPLKKLTIEDVYTCLDVNGRDFTNRDLRGLVFDGLGLQDIDFTGSDLRDTVFDDCGLYRVDFRNTDLGNARFADTVLNNVVSFYDANVVGVVFEDVDMEGLGKMLSLEQLKSMDLSVHKADVFDILQWARPEIPALRSALVGGRVNGTLYSDGECGCLIGTIGIARGLNMSSFGSSLKMEGIEPTGGCRPAEKLFYGIEREDTPENNSVSALVLEWLDEFEAMPTPTKTEETT